MALNVGQGLQSYMESMGDAPLRDSQFTTNSDGSTCEMAVGLRGVYIASNASGEWQMAGPLTGSSAVTSPALLGADVSNWSGPVTTEQLAQWKANGYGFVLVQAVSPPYPYPPGQTRQQCQAVLDAGLGLDAYVFLWFSETIAQLQYRLGLLDGFPIRRLWVDVEDNTPGFRPSARITTLSKALVVATAYPARLTPGIYTGAWFWKPFMGNTTRFSMYPLWDANYTDGVPDASVGFVPYGGWTSCAIKQYAGTSTLFGVPEVDLDAYSPEEAAA